MPRDLSAGALEILRDPLSALLGLTVSSADDVDDAFDLLLGVASGDASADSLRARFGEPEGLAAAVAKLATERGRAEQVDRRQFPVLDDRAPSRVTSRACPSSIPWSLLEPFEDQAKRNHGGQSLEELARRGGLAPSEIMAVVERRGWRSVDRDEAERWLRQFVASKTSISAATARLIVVLEGGPEGLGASERDEIEAVLETLRREPSIAAQVRLLREGQA